MSLEDINAALRQAGLTPRGAFHPAPGDDVPDVAPGQPAKTLVLAGNAGPDMWRAFSASRDVETELLDDWSRDQLTSLATKFSAMPLFPSRKPYLPFQRWARRAGPCHASPLGMFIHPDHGLWHGYRGALALPETLDLPPLDTRPSPCDRCRDRPCLQTCPVGAFGKGGYDVPVCTRHLASQEGRDCMELGCRARRACPIGDTARYQPAQAAFHMRAFLKVHRGETES